MTDQHSAGGEGSVHSLLPEMEHELPGQAKIQRAGLDTGYILDNAQALLADFDPRQTIAELELGFFQLKDKTGLCLHLQAAYAAIWALALGSSFPLDYQHIFSEFLRRQADLPGNAKDKAEQERLILSYANRMWRMKEIDFSGLSRHLLTFMRLNDTKAKTVAMKLALNFRRAYQYFFEHLL